ncbi:DNA-binding protein [Leifsonia sp. H3M29-4]|uniref:helix-turn-helix transcriptional regulator n=1 Tax=Salinibacterium metalliresistens TaxID=3031321 RepID=UPI0023DBA9E5|nr:helix-turn-helix domain-containing protein [Salinibacterium metalliresistens]MDF1477756.1 DNA-binding protein [Salinibacterium metalliresistens]
MLISPRQLTALLGVNMDTLKRWRQEGIGPAFIRPGEEKGRVAYAIADVEAWINTRRVRTAGAYEVLPLNLTVRTA